MVESISKWNAPRLVGAREAFPQFGRVVTDICGSGMVRARLQCATGDIHESLHRHPKFVRLMGGVLTKPEYSELLARLYGFHHPLGMRLRAVLPG